MLPYGIRQMLESTGDCIFFASTLLPLQECNLICGFHTDLTNNVLPHIAARSLHHVISFLHETLFITCFQCPEWLTNPIMAMGPMIALLHPLMLLRPLEGIVGMYKQNSSGHRNLGPQTWPDSES
jgi:hypothetical protein